MRTGDVDVPGRWPRLQPSHNALRRHLSRPGFLYFLENMRLCGTWWILRASHPTKGWPSSQSRLNTKFDQSTDNLASADGILESY